MASKREALRRDLKAAQQLAARLKNNMSNASPELSAYWQNEWKEAQAEVRRLQRELTS